MITSGAHHRHPAPIASLPANGDVYVSPTPVISLTNQPMGRKSVEKTSNWSTIKPETVPGSFAWADQGLIPPPDPDESYYDYEYDDGTGPKEVGVETVEFTPDVTLDFDTVYHVELPKGVKGITGDAETGADFEASFTVTPYPAIASTSPADGDVLVDSWSPLQITFNAPVNPDSVIFGKNLVIQPSVAVTEFILAVEQQHQPGASFPKRPAKPLRVTLARTSKAATAKLGAPTTIAWETAAYPPLVFMHSPGRIATWRLHRHRDYVTVRNLNQVDFASSTPEDDFIQLNGNNCGTPGQIFPRSKIDHRVAARKRLRPGLQRHLPG
jgi:hypothetical protein